MSELKPCPFCGGEAELVEHEVGGYRPGRGRKERVMVKSTEATKAIAYHLFCDKCGEEMESTNLMLTCDPPRYEHRCPKWGNKDYPRKQYPYIAFEWAERSETCLD